MRLSRGIFEKLEYLAQSESVLILEGARATGKTTLARHLVETGVYHEYRSFADQTNLEAAQASPADFINQLPFGTIIDEAQLVEDVTLPIKSIIDADPTPGRFLLTGSTQLRRTKLGGSDPLAGRTLPPIPMYPFTMGERNETLPKLATLDRLNGSAKFDPVNSFVDILFGDLSGSTTIDRTGLEEFLVRGGMPGWFDVEDAEIRELRFEQYMRGTIALPTFSGRDRTMLESFYRYLAGSTACLANFEKFSRSNGIQGPTAKQYLSLLIEAMLIVSIPGWRSRQPKVELQSPKLHVFDTGAAATLGGLRPSENNEDFGQLLETLVVTDLLAQASWSKLHINFFHWRYKQKHEVDLLLVDRNNRTICIEVKSNSTVKTTDFQHIEKFRELYPNQFFRGIVFYTGTELHSFGNDLWAVPVGSLCQTV